MKILHTSDWHIGRRLYDKSIDETLTLFFDWLINTVEEEKIDVLLVAGDIFNNPYPSQSSLKLYYRTLFELSKTNLRQIIITGGNHDSVSNLNAPKELLGVLKIKVVGGAPENTNDLIFEIKNDDDDVEIVIAAVPFLRQSDIRTSGSAQSFSERVELISKGIQNYYSEIAEKLQKYKKNGIPVIGMGHLFVNDVSDIEEDEKERVIGGLQQIKYSQIPPIFDYFALGHLHKPLRVGQKKNFRYSGSPVQHSFSEINNKNQVIIVDFNNQEVDISQKFIPQFRDLLHFKGTFAEISAQILNFKKEKDLISWADVEIIEEKQDSELQNKIDSLKEKIIDIEIIRFRYSFSDIEEDIEKKFEQNTDLKDLKPSEIFDKVLENYKEEDREILRETFSELVNNYLNN